MRLGKISKVVKNQQKQAFTAPFRGATGYFSGYFLLSGVLGVCFLFISTGRSCGSLAIHTFRDVTAPRDHVLPTVVCVKWCWGVWRVGGPFNVKGILFSTSYLIQGRNSDTFFLSL